jgi:hypothetical protein
MYSILDGIVYTATLIAIEGQQLRSLVFDPRVGAGGCLTSLTFSSTSQRMIVRNATVGSQSNIGYVGGFLDVSNTLSNIIPITTVANDDYFQTIGTVCLASIPYNIFYENRIVPFYAYIPDGSGGIKMNTEGQPLTQALYGPIYFYSSIWFPLANCTVTLSDQSTINGIVRTWLTTKALPSTRYFTTSGDCNVAVEYNYCTFRDLCTTTCNGPCLTADQTCEYNKNEEIYFCSGESPPPNAVSQDTTIIWFLVIALLVLVSLFILLMYM